MAHGQVGYLTPQVLHSQEEVACECGCGLRHDMWVWSGVWHVGVVWGVIVWGWIGQERGVGREGEGERRL